jgi:hypothetical protein
MTPLTLFELTPDQLQLLHDLAEWCEDFFEDEDKDGQWGKDAAAVLKHILPVKDETTGR